MFHPPPPLLSEAGQERRSATRLCALLSEITDSDEQLRENITRRLSLKQYGYGFPQLQPERSADFYKRANKFIPNSASEKGHLIPRNRKLYLISSIEQPGIIKWETSFEALQKKTQDENIPRVLTSQVSMEAGKNIRLERGHPVDLEIQRRRAALRSFNEDFRDK